VIGSLRGTVLERSATGEVVLEVGGVGYRLLVPLGSLETLIPGEPAFLSTHLHVRDDAMVLYGFATREERDTFEILIGAPGVGPKLGLAILSVHSPAALRRALLDDDLDALTLVPGIGKRTAQRLFIELKARLEVPALAPDPDGAVGPSVRADVRDALVGLGYSNDEVRDVLNRLPDDGAVEELVRDALRQLASARVSS
jgi:Holliday junction DNA helicase RuvA